MPLPPGEPPAAVVDRGVVAVFQFQNHLVGAGPLRGFEDGVAGRILGEAGNVLAQSAVEQFDVLGQVADDLAAAVQGPLVQRRAIEADTAAGDRPDVGQPPRQGGLAAARAADDADDVAGLGLEIQALEDRPLLARRRDGDVVGADRTGGFRQGDGHLVLRLIDIEVHQTPPTLARADEPLPMRGALLDGRQGARADDGNGDDHAGGQFAL